jgi:hypothetical protein
MLQLSKAGSAELSLIPTRGLAVLVGIRANLASAKKSADMISDRRYNLQVQKPE